MKAAETGDRIHPQTGHHSPWAARLVRGGGWLAGIAFVAMSVLMVGDVYAGDANPHIGLFAFLIVPLFVAAGLLLGGTGWAWARLRGHPLRVRPAMAEATVGALAVYGIGLASLAGFSGYRGFRYTESVNFCGAACHNVMQPEMIAFRRSTHARLACAECHVGPGAQWFLKSRMIGLKMAYHYVTGTYQRSVRSPHETMRSPDETCGRCHNMQRDRPDRRLTRTYRLPDAANSPWTIDLLLKIGGTERGAHWHTAPGHRLDFIATDAQRTIIPWVRLTDAQGRIVIFKSVQTNEVLRDDQVAAAQPITMNCLECHNRIGHAFASPEQAVNAAFAAGRLDPARPLLKVQACAALTNAYADHQDAPTRIAQSLRAAYAGPGTNLAATVAEVQRIYRDNFFPDMRTDWRAHPDHIGHMASPGCFRCHDGKHVSSEGIAIRHDCNLCHTILAQGKGTKPLALAASGGIEFDHPEDLGNRPIRDRCTRCHKGVPIP